MSKKPGGTVAEFITFSDKKRKFQKFKQTLNSATVPLIFSGTLILLCQIESI